MDHPMEILARYVRLQEAIEEYDLTLKYQVGTNIFILWDDKTKKRICQAHSLDLIVEYLHQVHFEKA